MSDYKICGGPIPESEEMLWEGCNDRDTAHAPNNFITFSQQIKRPNTIEASTKSQTFKEVTGCGNMYVTLTDKRMFIQLGKAGGCPAAHLSATAKLISMVLRLGGTKDEVAKELAGTQCPRSAQYPSCIVSVSNSLTVK